MAATEANDEERIVRGQEELQALHANEARTSQATQAREAEALHVRDVRKALQTALTSGVARRLLPSARSSKRSISAH